MDLDLIKLALVTRAAWKRLAKSDQTDADDLASQLRDLLDRLDKLQDVKE